MKYIAFNIFFLLISFFRANAQKSDTLIYIKESGYVMKKMVVNHYLNDSTYLKKIYRYDFVAKEWDFMELDTFWINKSGCIFKQFNGALEKHICRDDFILKEPFFEYFDRNNPKQEYERYTPIEKKIIDGLEIWIYDVRLMNIDSPLDVEYRLFYVPEIGEIKRSAYGYTLLLEKLSKSNWLRGL